MSQSWIDACKRKIASLEDTWTSRRNVDYDTKRRELADVHQELGRALMSNGPADPLTPEQLSDDPKRLQKAADEFDHAAQGYYRYLDGAEDDYAETLFRRALIAEKFAQFYGPSHYLGAEQFFTSAIRRAKRKKPYYEAQLAEFRKRRQMKP